MEKKKNNHLNKVQSGKNLSGGLDTRLFTIFSSFSERPENKYKERIELVKDFINFYNIKEPLGLLEKVSGEMNITFTTIKDESFSLHDILEQSNTNKSTRSGSLHLMFTKLGALGKDVEEIIITLLTKKIYEQVPEGLKKDFNGRFSSDGKKTLNTFRSAVDSFFDEHTNILWDTKVSVTNEEIKDAMIKKNIIEKDDISGSFKKRTETTKTVFDKLVSHQKLLHLQETVTGVEQQVNSITTCLGSIPSIKDILTPYYHGEKNIFEEGEQTQEMYDLQEKIANTTDAEEEKKLRKQLYSLQWRTIITTIETKNKPLADALTMLLQHEFDFSLLERSHQKTLLKEIQQNYISTMLNTGTYKTLGLEKHQVVTFLSDLFDLEKTSLTFPLAGTDGLNLSVKKGFMSGKKPGYLDLTKINQLSSLPFFIDVDLNQPQTSHLFEDTSNFIFRERFVTLHAKNGDFKIHEGYKIKVDNTHEGYLRYPYLCDKDGNFLLDKEGNKITIDENSEKNHTIEILDKTLHLQGNETALFTQSLFLGNAPLEESTKATQQDEQKIANLFSSLRGAPKTYAPELIANYEKETERIDELTSEGTKEKKTRRDHASMQEIIEHTKLSDDARILKAIEILKKEGSEEVFTSTDIKGLAILESHRIGRNELGRDGKNLACVFNYTDEQLKRKIRILKNAGFKSREIKALLEDGICGEKNDIANAEHRAANIIHDIVTTPASIDTLVDSVWEDYKDRDSLTKQAFHDRIENMKATVTDNNSVDRINDFTSELTSRLDRLKNKDYEGLIAAFEEFRRDRDYPQKTALMFLNFMKTKKGQNPGNYYGYSGGEIELNDNFSRLVRPVREELPPEETHEEGNEGGEGERKTTETKNDFQEALDALPGHPNWKFEKGARLWFKSPLESKLPPDTGIPQWCQLEITEIKQHTFSVKLTGGELSLGSMEGKVIDNLPLDKHTIENFGSDVYKLLPPGNDFNKQLQNFKASGVGLDDAKFLEEDIAWKGNKFEFNSGDNKGQEVVAFGTEEFYNFDVDKGKEETQKVLYNIKHNGNTFTVESEYLGRDEKGNKQKFSYKQTMDYNSFILFIASKKLKPKSKIDAEFDKKQFDEAAKKGLKGRKLKFFGLAHIIGAFKEIPKKIKEGLKKYQEKQKDEFTDFLVSDVGVYKKLTFLLGWSSGMKEALTNIEIDYYNERDAKTWKKVETRLKIFEADPDFGDSWGKKGYNKIVESGKLPKNPHMAGALLLANISQGGGPYSRLAGYRMKGQWIKLMLGEGHHQRFMQMQKEHIEKMKNEQGNYGGSYDADLVNELTRCEMTYLINNIGGRAPGAPFGSMADDNDPKRMWSDKFAGELEKRYNQWSSRSAIEERYSNLKQVTNFNFCYNEYKRYLFSGRSQHALAYFKKMATLAKSPQQINILKMGMMYGLVGSGFLHYADKATKGLIEEISRSMGFAPGLLVQHQNHPGKVAKLLDHITKGKFSQKTNFNEKDFGMYGDDNNNAMAGFIKKFEGFWYENNNGKTICDFLKDLPKMDVTNEPPLIQQMKNLTLEETQENSDPDVAKNKSIIVDSVLTKPKGLVNIMANYRDGMFAGKDNDEINAAQKFWNNVTKEVKSTKGNEFRSFSKIFLNWFSDKGFDETSKENFVRKLATAKKYKMGAGGLRKEDAKDILWYSIVGEITLNTGRGAPPQEFRKALDAFKDVFWNNLEKIDDIYIHDIFGKHYVDLFKKPYKLAPWDEYNRVMTRSGYIYDEDENAFGLQTNDKRTKEQKEEDRNKASMFRNKEIFLNREMQQQERSLERRGRSPSLSQKFKNNDIYNNPIFGIS